MKKPLLSLIAGASLLAGAALTGVAAAQSGPASHENPSSCLGAERSSTDEADGAFGREQSAFVRSLDEPFGQWLKNWMASCEFPPLGLAEEPTETPKAEPTETPTEEPEASAEMSASSDAELGVPGNGALRSDRAGGTGART